MRDHLLDLVEHTFDLGCIDLVKITGTAKETLIAGLAEDRSVVVEGRFLAPVPELPSCRPDTPGHLPTSDRHALPAWVCH